MTYPEAKQIDELVSQAGSILIVQPDNPDGDSLGSALALEQILMQLNKDTTMVCGVKLPSYLSYLPGWDRVDNDLPKQFDLAIIVDTSAISLIEHLTKANGLAALTAKPVIIIDHHPSEASIDFARVRLNDPGGAAAAEVIYHLSKQLNWELTRSAKDSITAAILSDTLGLTTDSTTAQTVYAIAELVESGVSLFGLENARRDTIRKTPEIVHYKGELLKRIEYYADDRVAIVTIPWPEIERYSPLYNPSVLALDDMRLTTSTAVAIALKLYPEGKITGKIRSNYGYPIAGKLAEAFGGGGHEYASGFKLTDNRSESELKTQLVARAKELIDAAV